MHRDTKLGGGWLLIERYVARNNNVISIRSSILILTAFSRDFYDLTKFTACVRAFVCESNVAFYGVFKNGTRRTET
jgi:hypothetical protein